MMNDGGPLAADAVTCDVFTRREGMLSAAGHDLRVRATRAMWTVDAARGELRATIEAAGLRVACAVRGGRDDPDALSAGDREKIDRALHDEVLEARRFPRVEVQATFARDGDRATVRGRVTLHGVEGPFEAVARRDGGWWEASCALDQTAFGIRPFTAMLGALKVGRVVELRVRLRWEPSALRAVDPGG